MPRSEKWPKKSFYLGLGGVGIIALGLGLGGELVMHDVPEVGLAALLRDAGLVQVLKVPEDVIPTPKKCPERTKEHFSTTERGNMEETRWKHGGHSCIDAGCGARRDFGENISPSARTRGWPRWSSCSKARSMPEQSPRDMNRA